MTAIPTPKPVRSAPPVRHSWPRLRKVSGSHLAVHVAPYSPKREFARRALNVTVALLGIIVSLPVMLLVALAVKLTSRGPIIYSQTRVGLDRRASRALPPSTRRASDIGGKPFTIYKFRTMRVDAESRSGAVWATSNDPRVTPIGGFLRRTRLDELPQLFNVLLGDMNIVGPRPERPCIFQDLRQEIPHYHVRQRARPGITGLAQVSQAYDSDLDSVKSKVTYDLTYIQRASFWEDLRIMLRTFPVMVFGKLGW